MTERTSFAERDDPFFRGIDIIGDLWKPVIIWKMFEEGARFEVMQETLGIARNILTTRLNRLIDCGVVEKVKYSDRPVRYEYHLTEMGHALRPAFEEIHQWSQQWLPNGKQS